MQIRRRCRALHPRQPAIAREQRPDARVRERIAVAPRLSWRGSLGARLALRLALVLRGAAFHAMARFTRVFHAASTAMSTSAMGRRFTCATSVMARPALVRPVSRTSSPYWG